MGTKTLTITNEAYDRLAALKGPKDSFSDVVMKITKPKSSLRDLIGIMPKETINELRKNIKKGREEMDKDFDERQRRYFDH